MPRQIHLWGGVLLAIVLAITEASAQRTCDLSRSRQVTSTQGGGGRVSYVSRPLFECTDGTLIEADSSVTFEATSFSQLFGQVVFRDGQRELHSDRAQYFSSVGRLQAQGSVRLIGLDDGSLITGEDLVLLQEGDQRTEDDMTVRGGRPHARLSSGEDDTAQIDTPFEIDADLIHLVGDRLLEARGRVEITRDDLLSYGDSVAFQQDVGLLTLYRNARIISPDEESGDTLDLRADTITMILPMDVMEELNAVGRAHLLTDAVDIRGPTIRLVFTDEVLNRIVAATAALPNPPEGPSEVSEEAPSGGSGEEGPRAVAEEFILTGDSIDVRLPGGELETVFAIGGGRGVSAARDSINSDDTPELIRHDWIEGDTITATFVTNPPSSGGVLDALEDPSEAASERRLDRLVAQGEARSFYRTTSDSGTGTDTTSPTPDSGPLELNYVLGDEIRLFMQDGEVDRMEVDQASGAFFQPNGASPGPPPPAVDTTAARPDRRRTP
jgi:hypothetical protein